MNKPVPPREAQTNAEPIDAPRDQDDRAASVAHDGADRDERPGHRDEPQDDAEDAAPKHDVIDLRPSETEKQKGGEAGEDREDRRPGDGEATDEAASGRKVAARKGDGADQEEARRQDDGKPGDGRDRKDSQAAPEREEKSDEPPPKAPPKIVFIAVGVVLLLCLAWGAYSHWRTYHEAQQTASDTLNRPYEVRTVLSHREEGPALLTLPGETDAFDTANIYARATGYISERRVDIGTRVKAGDLLVHIAAPDLDNQLAQAVAQLGQTQAALTQARAQVAQADANVNLAKVTFARTNQLTQQGYETLQNRDNQQANVQTQQANVEAAKAGVGVAEANVKAQQATVDRLRALTAFEDVRAPFDGVITSRSVDVGDLVNADTNSGTPMFTMSRDAVVRVTVRIPQDAATGILDGLEATVHVPQMPDHPFKGRVARTSGALLYSSRSLTAEVDVPNPDGVLRSGLYVTVDFQIPRQHPNVTVPAEALIFNQLGLQVASVEDGKAKMHSVTIFRDHGTSVELRDGLQGGEHVIVSPPATLADGGAVKETREEDQKKNDAQAQKPGSKGQGGDKKDDKSGG